LRLGGTAHGRGVMGGWESRSQGMEKGKKETQASVTGGWGEDKTITYFIDMLRRRRVAGELAAEWPAVPTEVSSGCPTRGRSMGSRFVRFGAR
jgi:hypothetical protein